jgi:hypothetical protein
VCNVPPLCWDIVASYLMKLLVSVMSIIYYQICHLLEVLDTSSKESRANQNKLNLVKFLRQHIPRGLSGKCSSSSSYNVERVRIGCHPTALNYRVAASK